MEKFQRFMTTFRQLAIQLVEAGFIFVGFIVLVYLLLGEDSGAYVISVITNLSLLISAITPNALVAIVLGLAMIYLIKRR